MIIKPINMNWTHVACTKKINTHTHTHTHTHGRKIAGDLAGVLTIILHRIQGGKL